MKKKHLIAALLCIVLVLGAVGGNYAYAQRHTVNQLVFWEHHYDKIGLSGTSFDLHYVTYADDNRQIETVTFPDFQAGAGWALGLSGQGGDAPLGQQPAEATNAKSISRFLTVYLAKEPEDSKNNVRSNESIQSRQVLTRVALTFSDGETLEYPIGTIILEPYQVPAASFWGLAQDSEDCFQPGNGKTEIVTGERTISVGTPEKNVYFDELTAAAPVQYIVNGLERDHSLEGRLAPNTQFVFEMAVKQLSAFVLYDIDVLYPLKNDKQQEALLPVNVRATSVSKEPGNVTALLKERGVLS